MQAIAPGKACPGRRSRSHSPPASPHALDRGGYRPGVWGPGRGTPLPGEKNHTGLPQGPRTGAGIVVAIPRERRSWEGNPKYCFPLASLHTPLSYLPHPTRAFGAPPPPLWAGAVQAIPRKGRSRGEPTPIIFSSGISPVHRTVGDIARGCGDRGGAPPSPLKRTILTIPQGSRTGAGAIVVMPRKGHSRGNNSIHRSPISSTPPAPLALLPRPRGRGQCRR